MAMYAAAIFPPSARKPGLSPVTGYASDASNSL